MSLVLNGDQGICSPYVYQTPATGFSYTITTPVTLLAPANTLATGTITMPVSPVDGAVVTVTSTQQITALTINANTGQSINNGGVKSLVPGSSLSYVYNLANTTWQPFSAGGFFGVGQTWTNVTGSRALNTTYTNTTGKPIMVKLWSGQSAYFAESVNGLAGEGAGGYSLTYVVPAGAAYGQVSNQGAGFSFSSWYELR